MPRSSLRTALGRNISIDKKPLRINKYKNKKGVDIQKAKGPPPNGVPFVFSLFHWISHPNGNWSYCFFPNGLAVSAVFPLQNGGFCPWHRLEPRFSFPVLILGQTSLSLRRSDDQVVLFFFPDSGISDLDGIPFPRRNSGNRIFSREKSGLDFLWGSALFI